MREMQGFVHKTLSTCVPPSSKSLVGDSAEVTDLHTQLNTLCQMKDRFAVEAKSDGSRINDLHERVLDGHAKLLEAESLRKRCLDPQQVNVLRNRPLDSAVEAENSERQKSARHIKRSIVELNNVLDESWSRRQEDAKKIREPALADVYKTLKLHRQTISQQRSVLDDIGLRLSRVKLTITPARTSTPARLAQKSRLSCGISPLRGPASPPVRVNHIDTDRVGQLRLLLSQRKAAPIRHHAVRTWSQSSQSTGGRSASRPTTAAGSLSSALSIPPASLSSQFSLASSSAPAPVSTSSTPPNPAGMSARLSSGTGTSATITLQQTSAAFSQSVIGVSSTTAVSQPTTTSTLKLSGALAAMLPSTSAPKTTASAAQLSTNPLSGMSSLGFTSTQATGSSSLSLSRPVATTGSAAFSFGQSAAVPSTTATVLASVVTSKPAMSGLFSSQPPAAVSQLSSALSGSSPPSLGEKTQTSAAGSLSRALSSPPASLTSQLSLASGSAAAPVSISSTPPKPAGALSSAAFSIAPPLGTGGGGPPQPTSAAGSLSSALSSPPASLTSQFSLASSSAPAPVSTSSTPPKPAGMSARLSSGTGTSATITLQQTSAAFSQSVIGVSSTTAVSQPTATSTLKLSGALAAMLPSTSAPKTTASAAQLSTNPLSGMSSLGFTSTQATGSSSLSLSRPVATTGSAAFSFGQSAAVPSTTATVLASVVTSKPAMSGLFSSQPSAVNSQLSPQSVTSTSSLGATPQKPALSTAAFALGQSAAVTSTTASAQTSVATSKPAMAGLFSSQPSTVNSQLSTASSLGATPQKPALSSAAFSFDLSTAVTSTTASTQTSGVTSKPAMSGLFSSQPSIVNSQLSSTSSMSGTPQKPALSSATFSFGQSSGAVSAATSQAASSSIFKLANPLSGLSGSPAASSSLFPPASTNVAAPVAASSTPLKPSGLSDKLSFGLSLGSSAPAVAKATSATTAGGGLFSQGPSSSGAGAFGQGPSLSGGIGFGQNAASTFGSGAVFGKPTAFAAGSASSSFMFGAGSGGGAAGSGGFGALAANQSPSSGFAGLSATNQSASGGFAGVSSAGSNGSGIFGGAQSGATGAFGSPGSTGTNSPPFTGGSSMSRHRG